MRVVNQYRRGNLPAENRRETMTQQTVNVESIENNGSYIPVVDGKLLTMPQGGAIRYRTAFEAEHHARQFKRGYVGGAFRSSIDDVI